MKILIQSLILFTLLSCARQNTEAVSPFRQMLEDYHEGQLKLYPLNATFAGDNRYNDLFPNSISSEFLAKEQSFYQNYLDKLLSFDRASLSETDQMSYDIFKWECEMQLASKDIPSHLTPIDQFWTAQLTMGQLASGSSAQPFKTVADYENWLKRLDAYLIWCETAIANMREGIKEGYVLPKSLIKKVIPQMASLDHGPNEEHLFYGPVKILPASFSDADKQRLTSDYNSMLSDKIIPMYKKLHDFFAGEYLAAGRESSGISAVPNGDKIYAYWIKYYTTTEMTADEIFELGKSEVNRITAEMEKVKTQVGFKGDLKSFFDFVRNKKELMPYTEAQQVIDHFNEIHNRMKPQLKQLFDLTPKSGFEVRRTEAFREASASAEYIQGSVDGTRPGIFYVPIPNVNEYNIYSDESLFLHEAIPGHHYQISLQQENSELPKFRQTLWYSAYGEGWALYSESLGKELGLYTDPYQYFGMLGAEIHRAIRLVVDAGMHTQGWTREQAIQYSLDHEAESEASIISEIERYMAGPAQALSYKIGQLKILELRKKAAAALGDKFDIRQFHNKVLESGCVPLKLLEDKIDRWISSQK